MRDKMRLLVLVIIMFACLEVGYILRSNINNKKKPPSHRQAVHETAAECSILSEYPADTSFSITLDERAYPHSVPLYENKSIDFECVNHLATASRHHRRRPKHILMWTKFKGEPFPNFEKMINEGDFFARTNCPVTNCRLTNNRTLFNQSQLVLFHVRNHVDYVPVRSSPRQRYVQVVYESAVHCSKCTTYNDTFNLTATYTNFSDFSSLYVTQEAMYWTANSSYDTTRDVHATKSQLAAALISNCGDKSLRLKYISLVNERLRAVWTSNSSHLSLNHTLNGSNMTTSDIQSIDEQQHLVKVYGLCGEPCPTIVSDKWSSPECRRLLADRAKFYFAIENSNCDDYITEKFFETLRRDTIPVVLGGGEYAKFVPRSGFINAMDFKSPADLADYMLYLDRNKTAYNAYFKWKRYVNFRDEKERVATGFLCEMCIRLHLEDYGVVPFESKRLLDLESMFRPSRVCKKAEYLPNEQNIRYAYDAQISPETFTSPE